MYRRSGGASSVSSASDPMLAEYISATERRGRAGARSRKRGLHHRHGGQVERMRAHKKASARASAEVRIEQAKELRDKHLRRLDEALRQGGSTLQSMLIMSERLTRIGGDEGAAMSAPQEKRIRNQGMAVANYFRALDDHYPKLGVLKCAEAAERNSGYVAAPWTIYRWSLEFMANGGRFLSDGRGDFDHDCFITSNEDIRRKLRNWMRSNLRHLTRAKAAAWVNETLIPKYVGGGDPAAMVKELKDKYQIDGTVSEYTVGRWMHLAGGEYVTTEKSYYCDSHESAENQAYRNAYLARDQGGVGAPSERELGQHLWIQMTAEVAEGFFAAHTAEGAETALRKSAYYYTMTGIEKGFIGLDGIVTDGAEAAAVAAAVAAELPSTRGRGGGAAGAAAAKAAAAVEAKITAARASPPPAGAVQMVEVHVELSETLESWRSRQPMGGRTSARYDRSKKPIIVNGQDESIFSSEAAPSRKWRVDGKIDCTPKTGVGIMVSAFVNCVSGFGLPMTPEELTGVNEYRKRPENKRYKCGQYGAPQALCRLVGKDETDLKPELLESPGVRCLHYGKDKDGYWDSHHMMVQMEDHADCLAVLFPQCQIVDEYDWSGVHGVKKEDGLDAKTMNVKFGGKVGKKHPTVITDGCIGPFAASINHDGVVHDRKLQVGQTQSMVFAPDDPPPFYALDTPKHDTLTGETKQRKKKKQKKQGNLGRQMGVVVAAAEEEEEEGGEEEAVVKSGYVGKPKGLLDVLFERGLLDPQLLQGGKAGNPTQYTKEPKIIDGIPDESRSLVSMLARCADFQNEPTAMQELTEALGHVQEKTPKKHPEIAGRGIEYCWGKSKVHFRHSNNYSSNATNLEARVKESMNTADVLTLGRVRKFQRKSNDYKRAYLALSTSPEEATELEHKDIENMKKKCKTHRCTLDKDYSFIKGA